MAGLVGFVPGVGAAHAVVVDAVADVAYVASADFGLSVVDLTDASEPSVLGAPLAPFTGKWVAVNPSRKLAVVTSREEGLRVVDVATLALPRVIGTLAGDMQGVAFSGNYAYVREAFDLAVVDLGTPSAPRIVARLDFTGGSGIALVGSLAYVAAGSAGLQVVDVATPTSPRVIGSVTIPSGAVEVAVDGGYAYAGGPSGFSVVDVRTPSNPAVRSSLSDSVIGLAAAGGKLYTVGGLDRFKIYDVANPASPALRSTSASYSAKGVAVSGTVAYLASPIVGVNRDQGGLYAIDVGSPTSPQMLGTTEKGFVTKGVAAAGTLAVVGSRTAGLQVVDVANLAMPSVVGSLAGDVQGVAMNSSYAYVREAFDLAVVDVRTPSAPRIVARLDFTGGSGIALVGSVAYVAAGSAGLQVVDVATPTSPRVIGTASVPYGAVEVAVDGGYAYVGGPSGFSVVDVRTPSSPAVRSSLAESVIGLAAAGGKLYTVGGFDYFKVYDVANPASPALRSTSASYGAQGIAVAGSHAYLGGPTTSSLRVYDVSSTPPVLAATLRVPGAMSALTRLPGTERLFAADYMAVVDILD
jgi:hypothetical protein